MWWVVLTCDPQRHLGDERQPRRQQPPQRRSGRRVSHQHHVQAQTHPASSVITRLRLLLRGQRRIRVDIPIPPPPAHPHRTRLPRLRRMQIRRRHPEMHMLLRVRPAPAPALASPNVARATSASRERHVGSPLTPTLLHDETVLQLLLLLTAETVRGLLGRGSDVASTAAAGVGDLGTAWRSDLGVPDGGELKDCTHSVLATSGAQSSSSLRSRNHGLVHAEFGISRGRPQEISSATSRSSKRGLTSVSEGSLGGSAAPLRIFATYRPVDTTCSRPREFSRLDIAKVVVEW